MDTVKVDKGRLLHVAQENMRKHVGEYLESVGDYTALVLKIARDNLKLAETGDLNQMKQMKPVPAPPVSYEASYKRAIAMLEFSVEEIIEVEQQVFNQLVLDEWAWKRDFAASSTLYKQGL